MQEQIGWGSTRFCEFARHGRDGAVHRGTLLYLRDLRGRLVALAARRLDRTCDNQGNDSQCNQHDEESETGIAF